MAEPRLRVGGIGSPEGVALEDETGAEVLRVSGGAASSYLLDRGGSVLHAEAEGLIGDPDDPAVETATFSAALAKAKYLRKGLRLVGGRRYRIDAGQLVDWSIPLVCPEAEPAVVEVVGSLRGLEFKGASAGVTTTLSASVQVNQDRIQVANAAGFAAGMLITLRSTALWYYDHRDYLYKGETHLIRRVVGNELILDTCTQDSYDTSAETVTVTAYNPISPIIENVRTEYATPQMTGGAALAYCLRPRVSSFGVQDAQLVGLSVNYCYGAVIKDFDARGINATTTGYGIQDSGSFGTVIDGMTSYGCRRGVDFSGEHPARGGVVRNGEFHGGGLASDGSDNYLQASGAGTHGPAEHVRFIDNRFSHMNVGMNLRGRAIEASRNRFEGMFGTLIRAGFGANLVVDANVYDAGIAPHKGAAGGSSLANRSAADFVTFGAGYDYGGRTIIRGNIADSLRRSFLRITPPETGDAENILAIDNTVFLRSNSSALETAVVSSGGSLTLANSRFDNTIRPLVGAYSFLGSGVSFASRTTEFADLPITASQVERWSGSGTLENVEVLGSYDKRGGEVRVSAFLQFEVIGASAAVRITGLPFHSRPGQSGLWVTGDGNQGLLTLLDNNGILYVSHDASSYNTQWPVGTHKVRIDFSYWGI